MELWQLAIYGAVGFVMSIFSGAAGAGAGFVTTPLGILLGLTAIEANITKRWSQLILNSTIILGVVGSGLIVWQVAAVGVASTLIGSFIGGRMAAQRGNEFMMHVMIVLLLVSGTALIVGG